MFMYGKNSIMKSYFLNTKIVGKENKEMSIKGGKKKWILIVVVAVAVLAVIIGVISHQATQKGSDKTKGTIDVITKRDIAISISGNGTIETATREDVTGGSYGMKIATVNVKEGDMVYVGDVICTFDTTDLKEQVTNLTEQVSETEANRKTQNADYDAQIAESKTTTAEQLAQAKENLAQAKATLAKEQAELAKRQKAYDDYIAGGGSITDMEAINLQSSIDSQKLTVDSAQGRVDSYQAQVDRLEEQDTSSIEEAKENYNDQVDSTVDNLQEQIENYEKQIENATIKATISGTVTAVNVSVGSNFTGGTIASIEAIDEFIVEAQIEEYDIPDISVGMKVLIKTDATRDQELEGIVTYVAPRATDSGSSLGGFSNFIDMDTSNFSSSNGSATYLVKISLKEQNERLRLGMNAKVSIITEESVKAWSVPYDAVHAREDGTTYLEVVTGKDEKGNILTKKMDVTVGIQGTYYIEVISDEIKEGIEILIPEAQGSSSISDLLNMMGADAGI